MPTHSPVFWQSALQPYFFWERTRQMKRTKFYNLVQTATYRHSFIALVIVFSFTVQTHEGLLAGQLISLRNTSFSD